MHNNKNPNHFFMLICESQLCLKTLEFSSHLGDAWVYLEHLLNWGKTTAEYDWNL